MSVVLATRAGRIAVIGLALLALASSAYGEPHAGVDSNLYRPSVDGSGVYTLDGAQALERYDLALKLGIGGGLQPLRVAVPGIGDDGSDAVLSYVLGLHMTLGFALTNRLTLALGAGLYRTDTDDGYGERGRYNVVEPEPSTGLISLRPLSNVDPSGGFEPQGLSGPLDARIGFKLQVIDGRVFDLAVLATASVPFGDEEMFLGDADFVFSPRLAAEYALNPSRTDRIVVNLGANVRRRTVLMAFDPNQMMTEDDAQAVLDIGSELFIGAGMTRQQWTRIAFEAEAVVLVPLPSGASYGSCTLSDGRPCGVLSDAMYFGDAGYGDLTVYVNAGASYRASGETSLRIGVGASPLGARGELFRGFVGVVWTPLPSGVASQVGGGDSDGDGNPDVTDICPDEVEDEDGFQDGDGCPETDNDGDGMADAVDSCPDDAEDKDGHLDEDGCPERDNDNDKILDAADRCLDEPEDLDGFEDDDGCPELDNDQDGIADEEDRCPNLPETKNGIADEDGCPDARTQTGPIEEAGRINLRGNKIAFAGARSARLTRASEDVLRQVADIIKARNLRIRVEVHVPLSTRSRNRRAIARARASDRRLAQKRAEAILTHLSRKEGVPLPALQAVGIGSGRPLEEPATRAINERVDFVKREQRQP